MWENYRSWLRWYCNAKYSDTEVGKVFRLVYKNYLKQNGYDDKFSILRKEE